MLEKSVLIAALARDCNNSILRNIPKIEKLRKEFKESHVVIIENDSKDGTKETLKRWEKESIGVEAIMNDYGTITIPEQSKDIKNPGTSMHRISKMAKYRNMYMDYARNADFNIDYLIVIDIDIEDFSVEGIIDSINNAPNDWGALFSNGNKIFNEKLKSFYDYFAYVPYGNEQLSMKYDEMFFQSRRIRNLLKKNKYVKCISAFGGIAVYKWEYIKGLNYTAIKNTVCDSCETLCEHIPFNNSILEQGANNYIAADMEVSYGHCSLYYVTVTNLPPAIYKILYFLKHGKQFKN